MLEKEFKKDVNLIDVKKRANLKKALFGAGAITVGAIGLSGIANANSVFKIDKDGTETDLAKETLTTPAGADGDLQINNSGSFGTIDGINLDKTGNARGTNALDVQSSRSAVTQVASGSNAVAYGINNVASNDYVTAVGYGNTADNCAGTAVGYKNHSAGWDTTAVGWCNYAYDWSTAVGYGNCASANESVAVGFGNTASGVYASSMGYNNTASGTYSTASGYYNTAGASSNTHAFGSNITNNVANSVEIGVSNTSKISILSAGTVTLRGALQPVTLADGSAPNNSIYYSSTASKLVYKDAGGTVNNLY